MLLFQITLLALLTLVSSTLQDYSKLGTMLYWIFWASTFLLYFYTSQTSPGYVTQNDLNIILTAKPNQFSDERSVSFSVEVPELGPKNNENTSFPKDNSENSPITPIQAFDQAKNSDTINTNRSEEEEEEEAKDQSQNHIEYENIGEIQITEIRHCTICRIDQPVRTKHCKECGRCVATHDHHCPWLGICIGERNKKSFYWYLILQFIQLIWTTVTVRPYIDFFEFR
jgi:DHHC palmitoyltransferase